MPELKLGSLYSLVPVDCINTEIHLVKFDESICVLSHKELWRVQFEAVSNVRDNWTSLMFYDNHLYVDHRRHYDFND